MSEFLINLFVFFVSCASYVGRIGRRQKLSLGSGCEYLGVIMHETMHALGNNKVAVI